MVKVVILLGFLAFSEIYGIPTTREPSPDDSSASETPRVKEWITFNPSWSFSSLPSISHFFHDNRPEENSMKLMKKRVENLEKSQKSMVELMKSLAEGRANSLCNTNKSFKEMGLPGKSQEINNEKQPTSPLTFSTTIDHLPVETNAMAPLKDIQSETTVPVGSEKPITNTSAIPVNKIQPTTPTNNNSSENLRKPSIEKLPLNRNENSSVSSVKVASLEEINRTEIPNPLESGVHQPENEKINKKIL